ncbi:MAG: phenylacetate-CoA oxygenase subunit PaaI [Gammaproteobacteria bacterium]|nr:phenylacetate-CoA oxygenase subunit PaaI [Gammaproteobacteria bacterium]
MHDIPQDMAPEYKQMAIRLLTRQVFAESATCELFGHAIALGPTWKDRVQQARFTQEESDHVRICADLLEALGEDVDELLERRGNAGEFFGVGKEGLKSWVEVVAFNLIGDRAGTCQIQAYKNNSLPAWGNQMKKILADEAQHQQYGADQTIEVCRDAKKRGEMQELINELLPVTVKRAFGRLRDGDNRYCVEVGLKRYDTDEVHYRFFKSLVPIMQQARLTFPSFRAAGVEIAPRTAGAFDLQ